MAEDLEVVLDGDSGGGSGGGDGLELCAGGDVDVAVLAGALERAGGDQAGGGGGGVAVADRQGGVGAELLPLVAVLLVGCFEREPGTFVAGRGSVGEGLDVVDDVGVVEGQLTAGIGAVALG